MGGNGFSSLKNFDALKEAGFNEAQARAILEMVSQDAASKQDLEYATAELKREIKGLDGKIEATKAELKRDIKELDIKIETIHARLQKKIEDVRAGLKKDMAIIMGSYSFLILGTLITLAKFGLLSPTP